MRDLPDVSDPRQAARTARLRYVSDSQPGFSRVAERDAFAYLAPDGARVTDEATIGRLDWISRS